MTTVSYKALALAMTCTILLSACAGNRMSEAEQKMAAIRNNPTAPIEPIPEPELVDDVSYDAGDQGVRSPFMPYSLFFSGATQSEQQEETTPDVNRQKSDLENYTLSEFVYHGRVIAPDGQEYGLVRLPNDIIREVKVGDYIGENDGRIEEITPTRIEVRQLELGTTGFRPRIVSLTAPN